MKPFVLYIKKLENLGKDWDLASPELVLNFLTRPNKVEKLIQLIKNDKEAWDIVKTIYFQDKFPFTYNIWRLVNINTNYPNLRHNVNNFKSGAKMAIEFQIMSQNFKASKKMNTVKAYLFQLLKVYFVNNQVYSIMLILNKCQHGNNK